MVWDIPLVSLDQLSWLCSLPAFCLHPPCWPLGVGWGWREPGCCGRNAEHWCVPSTIPATAAKQRITWAAEGKVTSMPANLLTCTKQNVHLESYWRQQNILTRSQTEEQTTGVRERLEHFFSLLFNCPGNNCKKKRKATRCIWLWTMIFHLFFFQYAETSCVVKCICTNL